MTEQDRGGPAAGRWDALIAELHRLRESAGTPSYQTLARDLMAQRMAEGRDEHAARVAKSSVHDAFRYGRSRVNLVLVKELVRVMGGDPAEVDAWVARDRVPAAAPPPAAEPEPALVAADTVRTAGTAAETAAETAVGSPTLRQQLALVMACLLLNLGGRVFVDALDLPVHLDMVGTAVAAFALGPWRGAAVGAATNVVGVVGSGWISLPFAVVNVVGALVWGYGARRAGLGLTLPRFLALNAAVALACSAVAVPLLVLVSGLREGRDVVARLVGESVDHLEAALALANVIASLGDKLLSGFVALVVVSALPVAFRAGCRLVAVDPAP